MRKRKLRKLREQAEAGFDSGFRDGTNLRLANESKGCNSPRRPLFCDPRNNDPAYREGHHLGLNGKQHPKRLPLEVWVQVLALDAWPESPVYYP